VSTQALVLLGTEVYFRKKEQKEIEVKTTKGRKSKKKEINFPFPDH
jgi:hypothetical protein